MAWVVWAHETVGSVRPCPISAVLMPLVGVCRLRGVYGFKSVAMGSLSLLSTRTSFIAKVKAGCCCEAVLA